MELDRLVSWSRSVSVETLQCDINGINPKITWLLLSTLHYFFTDIDIDGDVDARNALFCFAFRR